MPSRRLENCQDFSRWKDLYGDGCKYYAKFKPCGGKKEWDYAELTSYTDKDGYSAVDACCACGGGGFSTPAPTVVKSPNFLAIVKCDSCCAYQWHHYDDYNQGCES